MTHHKNKGQKKKNKVESIKKIRKKTESAQVNSTKPHLNKPIERKVEKLPSSNTNNLTLKDESTKKNSFINKTNINDENENKNQFLEKDLKHNELKRENNQN